MGEVSDATLIATLRRHLTASVAKQSVSASNLANLNTPGYKAREVKFADALTREIETSLRMATTSGRHLAGTLDDGPRTDEVAGLAAKRDGNTVQLDRELLEMTRASGEFQRAQTALAAKFRLVKYAINEAR